MPISLKQLPILLAVSALAIGQLAWLGILIAMDYEDRHKISVLYDNPGGIFAVMMVACYMVAILVRDKRRAWIMVLISALQGLALNYLVISEGHLPLQHPNSWILVSVLSCIGIIIVSVMRYKMSTPRDA